MSNQKNAKPRKPAKVGCKSMIVIDCKRTNLPVWGELYDYGMESNMMVVEYRHSKDPALLQEILERSRFERDAWLRMSPPEYAGAAKQCLNIEGHLFQLGYDKHAIKAAQDETDRYIGLSAPNWQEQLDAYRDGGREAMSKLPSCACCGKHIADKRLFCGQCMTAVYCSPVCQKEHWDKVHREQCGLPGCGFCGKIPEKPMKCGQCMQVTYCNKECQIPHWQCKHKKECKAKAKAKASA